MIHRTVFFKSIDEALNWDDLDSVNNWLVFDKLTLSATKTEFMVIGSRQRLILSRNLRISPLAVSLLLKYLLQNPKAFIWIKICLGALTLRT